ncbi:MAG: dihydrodipicolinate synthase family protein [Acidobacteria bacterium]|nr:dihydrodipicolinate synthase family protein [Acidobacteriota bacterium]
MRHHRINGLVAAVHTPFKPDGRLNLSAVERQAEHLRSNEIAAVFIAGSTGEGHSLTVEERRRLAERWMEVSAGNGLPVIVHVGANCLRDARTLAAHSERIGAFAISALAPSYFKPSTVEELIECCAEVAAGAPELPFYFYDIPSLTGVNLSMPEFLTRGKERIPNLLGIKWTNTDLSGFQLCRHMPGNYELFWGNDDFLLAGLALGATAAVGSSYSYAAPIYHRMIRAFLTGDLETARKEQLYAVQLLRVLSGYGYLGAAKAVMALLGVDVGPARTPNTNLAAAQVASLEKDLEQLAFFDRIRS